jgi:Archaeal/vacuolar-type H+-ATPase subunit A
MRLLQQESELQEIVQLVGPDALPERERLVLEVARMIREDFLMQNAYHDIDTYCSIEKQYEMLKVILKFHEYASDALGRGTSVEKIADLPIRDEVARMKYIPQEGVEMKLKEIYGEMDKEFKELT